MCATAVSSNRRTWNLRSLLFRRGLRLGLGLRRHAAVFLHRCFLVVRLRFPRGDQRWKVDPTPHALNSKRRIALPHTLDPNPCIRDDDQRGVQGCAECKGAPHGLRTCVRWSICIGM